MTKKIRELEEIDLTLQTITLGPEDNPLVSLMKGHVDELTYVKAFWNEGWDNDGVNVPTEEEFLDRARCEEGMLKHVYGVQTIKNGKMYWTWNVNKDEPNAEKVTIRRW